MGCPATINDAGRTELTAGVAREIAGDAGVNANAGPEMGAEDFAYLLEEWPGLYMLRW